MVKGIGSGLVSGGIVGTVVMAILSLYAPLPEDPIASAPVVDVETPTPQAVTPETASDNAVSQTDSDETVAPEAQGTTAPVVDAPTAPSDADSEAEVVEPEEEAQVVEPEANVGQSAQTPQVESSASALNAQSPVLEGTQSPEAEIASSDARAAGLLSNTPSVQPETGDEIIVASAGAANTPAAIEAVDEAEAATSPSVDVNEGTQSPSVQAATVESPTVVGTEKPEEVTTAAPATPKLPVITTPDIIDETEVASADTPITLPSVDSGVITNRLPSIGGTPSPETAAAAPPAIPAEDVNLGALRAFGTPVEGIEGKALFGIILIDSGEDGLPREDLLKLSVPVTIAIDPTAPNAQDIMKQYRSAGIEVVAIANELPTASTPSDVAVAVEAYFANLPQSVGIMDPLDGRIQSNRTLLQPVLGAIRNSGHGLITYDRGLNTAQQAARREDIPAATVFRVLDADLEEGPKIKRYLDRAAFNANRDGTVVVVGRSYSETVKAIVEWVLEKKEAGIAMVPVSAVMLADEAS